MDGNGRWAKKRNLPRFMGHKEGAVSVREITTECAKAGIKYLTLYAFSTENWKRPKTEVTFLMTLLQEFLEREIKTLMKNSIRFKVIGEISGLPQKISVKIKETEKMTAKNKKLTMILALNYGSRNEITTAVKKIAEGCISGKIKTSKISEKTISDLLYTNGIPDPDLLIRTSGEMRVSNFLLWQIAYSEIYVTDVLWPDFRKKDLLKALDSYSKRDRRFGGV